MDAFKVVELGTVTEETRKGVKISDNNGGLLPA